MISRKAAKPQRNAKNTRLHVEEAASAVNVPGSHGELGHCRSRVSGRPL